MTPEQSKKLWGRSARGPERGRWIDTGNGSLAWVNHPRPAPASGKRARKREMADA